MTELLVRLDLLSDTHVGDGSTVPGLVDAAVSRDEDGLPNVPGTTVRGLLRHGLELASGALDGTSSGWSELVTLLVGDHTVRDGSRSDGPARGVLEVDDARLPKAVRDRLLLSGTARHTTLLRSSTAIDERTGAARENTLRTIEVLAAGARLEASLTLRMEQLDESILFLLTAAAALIDGLGASRRRGLGRCSASIVRDGKTVEFDLEEATRIAGQPPSFDAGGVPAVPTPAATITTSDTDTWTRLGFEVRADAVIAVTKETRGNVRGSYDHVPGRVLLPVIARAVAGAGLSPAELLAEDRLRVGPATPSLAGRPGLPAPFTLVLDEDGTTLHNAFRLGPDVSGKAAKGGWVAVHEHDNSPTWPVSTPMVTRMRNQHGADGRVRREGGLFSTEGIETGTVLAFDVHLRGVDEAARGRILEGVIGDQRLGAVRSPGFGRATVRAAGPWDDPVPATPTVDLDLWVVTDVFLRDATTLGARPTAANLAEQAARAVGVPLASEPGVDPVDPRSRVRVHRHDAWHGRWGTSRPTVLTVAAGSVLRVRLKESPSPEAVAALQADGIGERRGEGFGRVLCNPALLRDELVGAAEAAARDRRTATLPTADELQALTSPEQTWLDAVDRRRRAEAVDAAVARLVRLAHADDPRASAFVEVRAELARLSPSQRGRLRELVSSPDFTPARGLLLLESVTRRRGSAKQGWSEGLIDELESLFGEFDTAGDDPLDRPRLDALTAGTAAQQQDGMLMLRRTLLAAVRQAARSSMITTEAGR